ncbi:cylM protein [Xenorhabdus sp. PB62.4]|nr:cylM protein [Xenorhabdus sp. PB62.4]
MELHIARQEGRLQGDNSTQRWEHFIEISSQPDFWLALQQHYPNLLTRIESLLSNRCMAIVDFATHWASDRTDLGILCGDKTGSLLGLSFDEGDSHQGRTVVKVTCEGGTIVYKPRSMMVDVLLADFLHFLSSVHKEPITALVPRTLVFDGHGWAEFVTQRYAANEEELCGFYRGIGQWLGVLRVLGGTDIHAQNIIARGSHPIVIDCETLFTPKLPVVPSGYGQAMDRATEWISGTVLSTGILPRRNTGLGWRGIDISSVGALPKQQPLIQQPVILQAGTDQAYLDTIMVPAPVALNHPSPQPLLKNYWPQLLDAFDNINHTLRYLDHSGVLRSKLESFANCKVRVVVRPTESYAELARMLWHPVSLHNEIDATERVFDLLSRMAINSSIAPSDRTVINAEITDLKVGDIPYFSMVVKFGQLNGPGGTRWLSSSNLIDATLNHWRAADLQRERQIIHATLVSAYINDGGMPNRPSCWPSLTQTDDVDLRRRLRLSIIMRDFLKHAIYGEDGSVIWIAPCLNPNIGWSIRPLEHDLYSGLSGVGLVVAAYLYETRAGRTDHVEGLDSLLEAILFTLRKAETKHEQIRADHIKIRSLPPGAYTGLGGQIWTWLTLDILGNLHGEGVARAQALAKLLPQSVAESEVNDVLYGIAGAIPPLLALAKRTRDISYLAIARELGDKLQANALWDGKKAYWPHPIWVNGLGGFSHGATGIGWSLSKLAQAGGGSSYRELAEAAFAFEESLFDPQEKNWLDLRGNAGKTATMWCHGAVGIGLAHLDLDPFIKKELTRVQLHRATSAVQCNGLGCDSCICHGDASAWELLDEAIARGLGPVNMSREALLANWLAALEQHGPQCDIASDSFQPGLMTGVGGIAYQLLRAHPQSDLPSVLTLASSEQQLE